MELPDVFATETMAELCVRQGRIAEAMAIYRRLAAQSGDSASRERLQKRLNALAGNGSGAGATDKQGVPSTVRPALRLPRTIRQPVRSGQVVYAEGGDLVVLAPVNPGGQVIADGNIHVYAPLFGRAVAGAHGCIEARIFCQRLEAELVGIDAAYVIADDISPEHFAKPAQVFMEGGRCVIARL